MRESMNRVFGAALAGYWNGDTEEKLIIHREDGFSQHYDMAQYFQEEPAGFEYHAIGRACGRVWDIGCGAGRTLLSLSRRGIAATGIDCSKEAVAIASARGARHAIQLDILYAPLEPHQVDAFTLFGNNIGLAGSWSGALRLLERLRFAAAPGARLWCDSIDICAPALTLSRDYARRNIAAGRPPGLTFSRLQYGSRLSLAEGWLFLSLDELQNLAVQTGWTIEEQWQDAERGPWLAELRAD
ncbi:methyltransferase domain-containing protein [Martelella alba]|uniref:Methyltransferase domain-containing protein n=1 Tax=Martelella alba TaxID=2590451 RepID=A0A506U555_9HYPH|nr:class I SAM-dependent methyltransferase [Martelella alba]TPW28214.1 methyltransferase domain-containing protein [Martelella alba]